MGWPFGESSTYNKPEPPKVTEMCDVCCKNFFTENIKRVTWFSKTGTKYVIRCCPFCDPNTLIKLL